ncbi:hypothetical protein NMY22_g15436 [Coprinellus aureogranulatus]|nr:hypothetical protein NMY22_g15436 [Coprinellus aureogranulatus]
MASLLQLRRIRQAHSTLRSTSSGQGPLTLAPSLLPHNHTTLRHNLQTSSIFTSQSDVNKPATMSDSGKFIVVFKEGVTSDQITKYANDVKAAGGEIKDRYDEGAGILNGFSATIPASFHANLAADDLVDYIEPDGVVTTQA